MLPLDRLVMYSSLLGMAYHLSKRHLGDQMKSHPLINVYALAFQLFKLDQFSIANKMYNVYNLH